MKCTNCGMDLKKKDKYCRKCGAETQFLDKLKMYLAASYGVAFLYLLFIVYLIITKEKYFPFNISNIIELSIIISIISIIKLFINKYEVLKALIALLLNIILLVLLIMLL